MTPSPPNLYTLKRGAVYDDLSPLDFSDIMWQAFEKDGLRSLILEISKPTDRIKIRVLGIKRKRKTRKRL